jgi:hypothetical protein
LPAATWNTQVRDNFLQTAPAKATTAGRLIVTTGVNAIAERVVQSAEIQTSESTTSTSNADLATVGPTVTVTTGPNAVVFWGCQLENATATQQSLMDFAVSGASTRAASDTTALRYQSPNASNHIRAAMCDLITGLTGGSNTFKAKYWCSGGTATFSRRRLSVMPL